MIKKNYIFKICLMLTFTVMSTICYATPAEVTEDNLLLTLNKLAESGEANNYNISIENNVITIKVNNESYTLNYDLTDKPTFSVEVPIQKGMTFNEFKEKTSNMDVALIGYAAVANIQGVDFEDAMMYILFSTLANRGKSIDLNNSYMIVDDSVPGVNASSDSDKVIMQSEFPDRIMEYVNAIYGDKKTISDSDGINSYEITLEERDVTNTSCKIVYEISVNLDANFSSLKGYADSLKDDSLNNENKSAKDGNFVQNGDNTQKASDITIANKIIPQAGLNKVFIIAGFIGGIAIVLGVNIKKYKDIK